MSLFFKRAVSTELIPARGYTFAGSRKVTTDEALRTSAVWAALRLRANLVSSLPVDLFRKAGDRRTAVTAPSWLDEPGSLHLGGPLARMDEWLYATQMDLDRYGNTFGLITERDGLGRPTRIDLLPAEKVSVRVRQGTVTYRFEQQTFTSFEIWHERQYVVAGLPVGLSPIAYAAWALGQYTSAQQFAAEWFASGAIPSAKLKNTAKTLKGKEAAAIKDRVKSTLTAGDVLVLGSDWDYEMIAVPPAQTQFLESQNASLSDLARFFDVPGDVIDAAVAGSSITYANIVQRNLQLLILHLGPAVGRREKALSGWFARPQFVKLNVNAFLRLDPQTQAQILALKVDKRVVTPDEWRELDDRPPLTPEQEAQFARLFLTKSAQPEQVTKEIPA